MQSTKKPESLQTFAPPRRSTRKVPAESVTVAVLIDGIPSAYGVVTNISEGGACIQTREVSTRRTIHVMLSFANGEMLDANGRVVWSKPLSDADSPALFGIEFMELNESKRDALRSILDSSAFLLPDC